MSSTTERPGVAEFYERDVLPVLSARLDEAFPEFGWRRDARGWHATNQGFTHAVLGVRADRVVCHGPSPRGFLIHGEGPVLWTTYVNQGGPARGRDFIDAVRRVATRAGVDASALDRPPTVAERRARLFEDAFAIARRELVGERGETARSYLAKRGIPSDQIGETNLGLLPPADRLGLALEARTYTAAEIHASQLLSDTRWAGRIVGAWRDDHHRIITFWARNLDSTEPRYLYLRGVPRSAEIPYGLSDLRKKDAHREVVLVEGVLDVHTLRAHTVTNVAALGGTATSRALFERLAHVGVERVILALDNDPAGRAATAKAIDHAVQTPSGPDVWVIDPDLYDQAKDPGDVIRARGAAAWRAVSYAPVCGITWRALDLTGPLDEGNSELARRAALAIAGAWLGALPPRCAVEQTTALTHLAESLGYDPAAVYRSFQARYWRHSSSHEHPRSAAIEL